MEDKVKLNFLAGVQVEDNIYFSAWNMNGLFKYNPEQEQCDFLKIFPGEENWGLHSEAILYKNTIWFIPRASERIAIVDLFTLDITYLDLPEYGHRPEGHVPPIRMRGFYINGENFLFLIPVAYKLFLKIDMEKREIVNVENWGGDEYARAVGVRIQDRLMIYINCCNEIREMDLISGEYTIKKIKNKGIIYAGIQKIGINILLFPIYLQDGIVLLNENNDEIRVIQLDDDKQWYYEYQTFTKDNDLLLIPYEGTKGVRISKKDSQYYIKEFKDLEVGEKAYCSTKIYYNDAIWFLSHVLDNPIICYEKQKDSIQYFHIEISKKKYNEDIIKCISKYSIEYSPFSGMNTIYEFHFLLPDFLQSIEKQKHVGYSVADSQIGTCIYESIK